MRLMDTQRALSAVLTLALVLPAAMAQNIDIRSNTVVPVVMEDELSFKSSREGDRFFAVVEEGRDLPRRSRLEGRIINIERQRGDQPAFMDVEFDTLHLPDGTRERIRAVPIALDSKYVSRDRDGRLVAKKGAVRKDQYVWGGVLGGAILGSILGRKTFEGAFVGAIAGIILAETNSKQEEVALKRGTRLGALFENDVRITFDDNWDRTDDPRYRTDRYDRFDRQDQRGSDSYQRREDRLERYDGRYPATIQVEYDGRDLRFGNADRPYRNGESVMVPLQRVAGQMGIAVEVVGKTVYLEDEDSILRLEQDSTAYRLNGKRGHLSKEVVKRGNTVYVPLEVLATMKRQPIYVNGDRIKSASN